MVRRVSILADPPLLLAKGESYARILPESAQGPPATTAAATLVLGAFWGAAAAFWFDHPATVPVRRSLGYRSGREFMLRFPLPDRPAARRRLARGRRGRGRVRQLPALALAWLGPRPPGAAEGRLSARETLARELREHALVIGEVTLTSGRKAQYLIDAKRAILRPAGFLALAELVAEEARRVGATAVGGITMGADPIACAALAGGADAKAFFV